MRENREIGELRRLFEVERPTNFSATQLAGGAASGAVALLGQLLLGTNIRIISLENQVLQCIGASEVQKSRVFIACPLNLTDAAAEILYEAVYEAAREHICYCVMPTFDRRLPDRALRGYLPNDATVIPVYVEDLAALLLSKATILQLYEYKLFRRLIQDKTDPETEFSDLAFSQFQALKNSRLADLEPFREDGELADLAAASVQHPLVARLGENLRSGRNSLLVGLSSAGKSVLAAQVMLRQVTRGESVWYANLSRQVGYLANLYELLLSADANERWSILLDDLQSNPTNAKYAVTIISAWQRATTSASPTLVGICWPEFSEEAVKWFYDFKLVVVHARQVTEHIAADARQYVSKDVVAQLSSRYGDDLLLLGLFLNEARRGGSFPTAESIASGMWAERTRGLNQEDAQAAVLVVSSLGRFDIATPQGFLEHEGGIDKRTIEQFIKARLFRRTPKLLSFGHRSLCGFICDWLTDRDAWKILAQRRRAKNTELVVLNYLKSCDASVAIDTLRGLQARVGFKEEHQLNIRAATIIEVWQAFDAIIERLEHQQQIDPTWNRVPSSIMFAALAFAAIGKSDLIEGGVVFLRTAWNITQNRLNIDLTKLSTRHDFTLIRERMAVEDQTNGRWKELGLGADEIDIDRFHRTWVSGLILSTEATATNPLYKNNELALLTEAEALPNGCFYPARVPWCTARVLLGLADCGRTIHTSQAAKRAAEWLLGDTSEGGASHNGLWESGTGSWNTILEATAMVLVALSAIGFDMADPRLVTAKSYLLANRADWIAAGKEVDGAIAVQAVLTMGSSWEDVAPEVQRLSAWARGEAVWQTVSHSASESLEQSCRVAQIACHLIDIGWRAIQSDLPAFLEALATPRVGKLERQLPTVAFAAQPSGVPTGLDEECKAVEKIKRIALDEFTVVGDCRRFSERVRNELKNRFLQICKALREKNSTHENFLVWAPPGSGKSFFVQETYRYLGSEITYIEINFAKQTSAEIAQRIQLVYDTKTPVLVLLDEIDACPNYIKVFPMLDINADGPDRRAVFVAVGSTGQGLESMKRAIANLPTELKGLDLISRIPPQNHFEIAQLTIEDQIVVFASQINLAARQKGMKISSIERLALYYVLKDKTLQSVRNIRDLAHGALSRVEPDETRLRYDHLFERTNRNQNTFWTANIASVLVLSERFVPLV